MLDWKGPKLLQINEVEERFLSRRFCIALNKPSNIASSQLVSEASFFFAEALSREIAKLTWNNERQIYLQRTHRHNVWARRLIRDCC